MKTYIGIAHAPIGGTGARDWLVTVHDERGTTALPLHSRHSPDGHSWGYGGSGPAQLALDLLWDHLGYEPVPKMYQDFKWQVVARWPQDGDWTLTSDEIAAWLGQYTAETV